jgi:four helix bundle protein
VQRQEAATRKQLPFSSLVVWQKAQLLASDLVRIVDGSPSSRSASTLGNQVLRSAGSIPANIAEGYGRYSDPAYRNHLSIARGSLFETESWIDLLGRVGYISEDTSIQLFNSCEEIGRLITASMKPLPKAVREDAAEYDAKGW